MIGVIEVTDQEMHNVVTVDFHDRTTRPSTHFQDPNKYNIASLGMLIILSHQIRLKPV